MALEKQRPGFMVYFEDWNMPRQILNAQDFKLFFDAVFEYADGGEIPKPFENHTLQVFFDTFMAKIQKDADRYQDICNKRREAAKKSHAQQSSKSQQMQANAANTNDNYNINSNQHEYQHEQQRQYQMQKQTQTNGNNQMQNASLQMHGGPFTEQEQLVMQRMQTDDDIPF